MPVALCIKCGSWKQAPVQRCTCGFLPARGSLDEARSVVLTEQFHSARELEELARAIRAGQPVRYDEEKLGRARGIGRRSTAVNLGLLGAAVTLGALVGGGLAGAPGFAIAALVVAAAIAVAITGALIGHVRRRSGG
jgi:hypothetical protein